MVDCVQVYIRGTQNTTQNMIDVTTQKVFGERCPFPMPATLPVHAYPGNLPVPKG